MTELTGKKWADAHKTASEASLAKAKDFAAKQAARVSARVQTGPEKPRDDAYSMRQRQIDSTNAARDAEHAKWLTGLMARNEATGVVRPGTYTKVRLANARSVDNDYQGGGKGSSHIDPKD